MVEDFSTYKWRVNKKEHLDPRDYGLSKNKFRHLKVSDLLDENRVKSLNSLKDELGLSRLHYLSHSRLERVIQHMKTLYPDLELRSNGLNTPVDKQAITKHSYPTIYNLSKVKTVRSEKDELCLSPNLDPHTCRVSTIHATQATLLEPGGLFHGP